MSWYLDLSLLIAALLWASSNHQVVQTQLNKLDQKACLLLLFQTSTAVVTLTIAYLISFSMAMVPSPPGLHSVAALPIVSSSSLASPIVSPVSSSTVPPSDHSHPSSIEDCKVSEVNHSPTSKKTPRLGTWYTKPIINSTKCFGHRRLTGLNVTTSGAL